MGLDFLVPIFGILLVLVPVTGLTTILTVRFASKPIVEAIKQLRGEGDGGQEEKRLRFQLQEMNETVELLTAEVQRLKEAQAFDRQLMETTPSQENP